MNGVSIKVNWMGTCASLAETCGVCSDGIATSQKVRDCRREYWSGIAAYLARRIEDVLHSV